MARRVKSSVLIGAAGVLLGLTPSFRLTQRSDCLARPNAADQADSHPVTHDGVSTDTATAPEAAPRDHLARGATVRITGYIRNEGAGIPGVILQASDPPVAVTSATDGSYAMQVPAGWSGQVTVSKTGFTFEPPSRSYDRLSVEPSSQDYRATSGTTARETYYVAVDGSPTNDGSRSRPWPSVRHALSRTGGGVTVIVLRGTYGVIELPTPHCNGRPGKPTIIRSEVKWGAEIRGGPRTYDHGISPYRDNPPAEWLIIDGFKVTGCTNDGIRLRGGHHNVVRNCWTTHNGYMGITLHTTADSLIERNLVENNGRGRPLANGIYTDGLRVQILNNVCRFNGGAGIQLYSDAGLVRHSVVLGNLLQGNDIGLFFCPRGRRTPGQSFGNNRVANNTFVGNDAGLNARAMNGDFFINNIFASNKRNIEMVNNHVAPYVFDHNLLDRPPVIGAPGDITPRMYGRNNRVADPGFVKPDRGLFWLAATSPAIGAGSGLYAPSLDFWGRPTDEKRPYLGAFPFVQSLTKPGAGPITDYWLALQR